MDHLLRDGGSINIVLGSVEKLIFNFLKVKNVLFSMKIFFLTGPGTLDPYNVVSGSRADSFNPSSVHAKVQSC